MYEHFQEVSIPSPKDGTGIPAQGRATMSPSKRIRLAIVVLGDLGRSPRMLLHALAAAENLGYVDLIGQAGTNPPRTIREHPRISLRLLRPPMPILGDRLSNTRFLGYALLTALSQGLQLLWALLFLDHKPDFILLQNPPTIPTLLVGLVVARFRSAKLVIDWHNFGYTMLSMGLGRRHPVVRLAQWIECSLGRRADAHFCVSRAMHSELTENWGIVEATVLYDCPAEQFTPTPLHVRHDLFRRLRGLFFLPLIGCGANEPICQEQGPADAYVEETLVTRFSVPRGKLREDLLAYCSRSTGEAPYRSAEHVTLSGSHLPASLRPFVRLRPDRPAILVSPTSWSEDEDFALLLEAASRCDEAIRRYEEQPGLDRPFPYLLILITGRGPLRKQYEKRIARLALHKILLRTLWLSGEDYPLLLGAADLGICVHRSSSGFDLPMKVMDMFGSGLPVCALDYGPCLAEQVRHGENGLLFSTGADLAEQLFSLFKDFPAKTPVLDRLRTNINASRGFRWMDNWRAHVLSSFVNP